MRRMIIFSPQDTIYDGPSGAGLFFNLQEGMVWLRELWWSVLFDVETREKIRRYFVPSFLPLVLATDCRAVILSDATTGALSVVSRFDCKLASKIRQQQ